MKRHGDFEDKPEKKIPRTEERPNTVLPVTPIESLYSEHLPSFRRPVEIGHFSLDVERKFHDDNHQLKYFCPPHTIKFDLTVGYKDFIARDEDVKEKLDHLLMWVDKHRDKFELPKRESVENGLAATSCPLSTSLNTDFITWRGHITKLLCTPYETREPWKMAATLHKRTIYLSEMETIEAYQRRKNMEEKHKEMCYWGHKFEDYVCSLVSEKQSKRTSEASTAVYRASTSAVDGASTSAVDGASTSAVDGASTSAVDGASTSAVDGASTSAVDGASTSAVDRASSNAATASTSRDSRKDRPCNNCEGFISVVRTRLEKHSLVFGAEVDCCTRENEQSPGNYIELKTSAHPHNQHQHRSFKRYKLLKWWAQSYLAGIPKIICGFRHHHGHVNELQTYNTLEIPRLVRQENSMWDMNICLNFLNKFLEWVKTVVVKDDPKKVYLFSFEAPFNYVSVVESSSDEDIFLPEWYTKEV